MPAGIFERPNNTIYQYLRYDGFLIFSHYMLVTSVKHRAMFYPRIPGGKLGIANGSRFGNMEGDFKMGSRAPAIFVICITRKGAD